MSQKEILTKAGSNVLRTLCRYPYKEFYPSELARKSDISLTHTNRILKPLREKRIVNHKKSGKRDMYRINLENILAKEFLDLFHAERRLELQPEFRATMEEFVRKLKKKLKHSLVSIILFGSVAKKKAEIDSDVDLVIITDNLSKAKKKSKESIEEMTDIYFNVIQEHVFTKKKFKEMFEKGSDFIINILKDGIILYDDGFYKDYLNKPLPRPSKEYIEEVLNFARKRLLEANDMCSEGLHESAIMPMKTAVRDCCRALLLIKCIIPRSKHELIGQVESVDPKYSKLLKKINILYRKHMEKGEDIDKDTIIKYLTKLEDLLKYTLRLFESD